MQQSQKPKNSFQNIKTIYLNILRRIILNKYQVCINEMSGPKQRSTPAGNN